MHPPPRPGLAAAGQSATELGPTAPFGSWPSPVSAAAVAAGGVKLEGLGVHGDEVWWLEVRPAEKGRAVLVSTRLEPALVDDGTRRPGTVADRLGTGWSARSRVHEYGGGAWWFGRRHVFFVNADDQRLHRLAIGADGDPDAEPEPLTPVPPTAGRWRYADGREHPNGSMVVCIRESHGGSDLAAGFEPSGDHSEPINEIVAVATNPEGEIAEPQVLITGPDFVAEPRFSPDGGWLSWIQWSHPNMPWDRTTLLVAPLSDGVPGEATVVAEGAAIVGADWTNDGRLVYSSDVDGRWNLYCWGDGTTGVLTRLDDGEIGVPPWVFGLRRWVELDDGRLVAVVTTDAVDSLVVVDHDGIVTTVPGFAQGSSFTADTPVVIEHLAAGWASGDEGTGGGVVVVAATPTGLPFVAGVDVDSGETTMVRPPDAIGSGSGSVTGTTVSAGAVPDVNGIDPAWLSVAEPIWFDSNDRRVHAFLYPPASVGGGGRGRPPLIVIGHGGPTSHSDPSLSLKVQYWTSRGFAVVDVNYGGSSGFGREYRERLHGGWGVVDVEDCINAARQLAAVGMVDADRMAIRGSSAGGLTVLSALSRSDAFAAGVSLYGVADLEALAADTHKFEARYLDRLVGPPETHLEVYRERSPLNHADAISTPMLVMQGSDDAVVPPSQSEAVVAALEANGVDHAYVLFEGEGHGFRRADTIVRSLELELWFYGRVFGFEPADDIAPPEVAAGRGLGLSR